jgi:transcriptional/translational regulatory protein YebC/TACO1
MTAWEEYLNVKEAIVAAGYDPEGGEVTMQAEILNQLDANDAEKILRLVDVLEDLDDFKRSGKSSPLIRKQPLATY